MENPFKLRKYRNETRGSNDRAIENEEGWNRVKGLYAAVLEKSKDRIRTREKINEFVKELRHLYAEEELRTYRAYNLITNSGEAGPNLDFPDNRIQNFLDELLLEALNA